MRQPQRCKAPLKVPAALPLEAPVPPRALLALLALLPEAPAPLKAPAVQQGLLTEAPARSTQVADSIRVFFGNPPLLDGEVSARVFRMRTLACNPKRWVPRK